MRDGERLRASDRPCRRRFRHPRPRPDPDDDSADDGGARRNSAGSVRRARRQPTQPGPFSTSTRRRWCGPAAPNTSRFRAQPCLRPGARGILYRAVRTPPGGARCVRRPATVADLEAAGVCSLVCVPAAGCAPRSRSGISASDRGDNRARGAADHSRGQGRDAGRCEGRGDRAGRAQRRVAVHHAAGARAVRRRAVSHRDRRRLVERSGHGAVCRCGSRDCNRRQPHRLHNAFRPALSEGQSRANRRQPESRAAITGAVAHHHLRSDAKLGVAAINSHLAAKADAEARISTPATSSSASRRPWMRSTLSRSSPAPSIRVTRCGRSIASCRRTGSWWAAAATAPTSPRRIRPGGRRSSMQASGTSARSARGCHTRSASRRRAKTASCC